MPGVAEQKCPPLAESVGDAMVDAVRREPMDLLDLDAHPLDHALTHVIPRQPVVLLRRTGWGPADYDAWSRRLLERQIAFVVPTVWEGETVARFAFLHPDLGLGRVRTILADMAGDMVEADAG